MNPCSIHSFPVLIWGKEFVLLYIFATYVSTGIKGKRHCCHGEGVWQPDSLTGTLLPHLYNLHANRWPARLLTAGIPALHLCLATAQCICVHFSHPVFSAHVHTHIWAGAPPCIFEYCGEAHKVLLSHPPPSPAPAEWNYSSSFK